MRRARSMLEILLNPEYPPPHLYGSVVWVKQQFGQRHYLWCAIPAIRTVHQDGPAVPIHSVHYQQWCLQQQRQMLQPFCAFKSRQPTERPRGRKETLHTVGYRSIHPTELSHFVVVLQPEIGLKLHVVVPLTKDHFTQAGHWLLVDSLL